MSQPEVVVVGSVNADLVVSVARLPRAGETVAGGTFARFGGGKGANQAVAAARAGARVTMVGAVGADDLGDEALRELAAEGIDVSYVARLDGVATGVAAIMVDAQGENQIAVASGANAALGGDEVARALAALAAHETSAAHESSAAHEQSAAHEPSAAHEQSAAHESSAAHEPLAAHEPSAAHESLAGPVVVLLSHEVPPAAVEAGIVAARRAGWTAVLNPAPARELRGDLTGVILIPNAYEAQELTGEADTEAAARALAARTGAPLLVTLGAEGALLVDGDAIERLPAPAVEVVDTTGAGDAACGALAAELAAGRPLRDAAVFALTAASLSTRSAGAREGMPARAEILAAL